ncbi:MAG TPA: N-formylglutamate amidohydrolase [Steroidobacteraceae bacterium]|nr:N-formylglutamate amidohydrolase [Steroidobacteraceae bacterium]
MRWLEPDEPEPFRVEEPAGRSPFLLTCDHASALVPRRLNSLGLPAEELQRHIAWDLGAAAVALKLAARLGAFLILQNYSRLVIDCNRPPGSAQSVLRVSDGTRIPGNESVSPGEILAREREVFYPYHNRIQSELNARLATKQTTILVAMHSFTPVFHSIPRPWQVGVLYHRDRRLADLLLSYLMRDSELVVGNNEPYSVSDETDYTIPVHGERRGLLHAEVELRQDVIADEDGQSAWTERMAQALLQSLDALML